MVPVLRPHLGKGFQTSVAGFKPPSQIAQAQVLTLTLGSLSLEMSLLTWQSGQQLEISPGKTFDFHEDQGVTGLGKTRSRENVVTISAGVGAPWGAEHVVRAPLGGHAQASPQAGRAERPLQAVCLDPGNLEGAQCPGPGHGCLSAWGSQASCP